MIAITHYLGWNRIPTLTTGPVLFGWLLDLLDGLLIVTIILMTIYREITYDRSKPVFNGASKSIGKRYLMHGAQAKIVNYFLLFLYWAVFFGLIWLILSLPDIRSGSFIVYSFFMAFSLASMDAARGEVAINTWARIRKSNFDKGYRGGRLILFILVNLIVLWPIALGFFWLLFSGDGSDTSLMFGINILWIQSFLMALFISVTDVFKEKPAIGVRLTLSVKKRMFARKVQP